MFKESETYNLNSFQSLYLPDLEKWIFLGRKEDGRG